MVHHRFEAKLLERMRGIADPLADSVVAELFTSHRISAVNQLFASLVRNDSAPQGPLPPVLNDYLQRTALRRPLDWNRIQLSERLFTRCGPEILLVLGFYSLPSAYAASNGVQVLERTGYLKHRPLKRLLETTQMVVDVLRPGGLRPHGRGIRSAQKVRLIHAAVRHLIRHNRNRPWLSEYGVPINQEDLAGTLMTFSYLVLDGLERLRIEVSAEEREAFLYTWVEVGRLLGIESALLPNTLQEAAELTRKVYKRQIAASEEGRALTQALIAATQEVLPGRVFADVPAALIRHFLERDPYEGRDVAQLLGVPDAPLTQLVLSCLIQLNGRWSSKPWPKQLAPLALRRVSLVFIESLLRLGQPGRDAFQIPYRLGHHWGVEQPRNTWFPAWSSRHLFGRSVFGRSVFERGAFERSAFERSEHLRRSH